VFGSEEYSEFVDSTFNDAFAFFLYDDNGNPFNIALLDNGAPVSINTVNCGRFKKDGSGDFNTSRTEDFCEELFVDNTKLNNDGSSTGETKAPTRLNGFTRPIYTNQVTTNGFQRLKIVIADAQDSSYDSAVLLRGKSLVCEEPPAPPTPSPTQGMYLANIPFSSTTFFEQITRKLDTKPHVTLARFSLI
jgi:hypothetical protein